MEARARRGHGKEAMENEVWIREASREDAEAVAACLLEAFDGFRSAYPAEAFADTVPNVEGIVRRMESMRILAAWDARGEVAGTIAFGRNGAEGHLRGMAVRPKWQGRGVAERILEAAEADLRAAGCERVTLDTTAPLARAIRFYERQGYVRSGVIGDFYGMALFEFVKTLRD